MTRTLEINGKSASVLGLLQPSGTQGLEWVYNQLFRVVLENKLTEPTAIHWHGLYPPNNEDGVPGVTQPVIRPNESSFYNFPVIPAGTHWMHSHQGLQEARLLSAPLIVHDSADQSADVQQVIVFFGDFSFTPPKEIYAQLIAPKKAMAMGGKMPSQPDANDVNYDAYLANDRTLADPDVVRVEKSGRIRLRIINGSSGTNYFVDLGSLTGELIATDGLPVKPIRASRFPLTIAQRIDVMVQIPAARRGLPHTRLARSFQRPNRRLSGDGRRFGQTLAGEKRVADRAAHTRSGEPAVGGDSTHSQSSRSNFGSALARQHGQVSVDDQ